MLLAYIPTSKLEGILNKTGCRRAVANLYHACMELILKPISSVGEAGISMMSGDGISMMSGDGISMMSGDGISMMSGDGISMMSGDGIWCQCHPILASFVGD